MRRRLGHTSVAAAAVLAAAPPGAADGAIVPQSGIAGVSLGQTERAVRDAKGAPVRVLRGIGAFGPRHDLVRAAGAPARSASRRPDAP